MSKGVVLAYSSDVSAGIIKSENERKFYFSASDFKSDMIPHEGLRVSFESSRGIARNIVAETLNTAA